MAIIHNLSIGFNKGRKRLWMVGAKLERFGFLPDSRFNVSEASNDDGIEFTVDPNGKYKVTAKDRNNDSKPTKSLIDHKSDLLEEKFEVGQLVRVQIQENKIIVTLHHQPKNEFLRESRLLRKLRNGEALTYCSLYHGGGVLDTACHDGFKRSLISTSCSIVNELENVYLDTSMRNNPELFNKDTLFIEGSICHINMLRNVSTQVDGMICGIPCTGASRSGRSKNKLKFAEEHEEAGSMFFYFLTFVLSLNPSYLILENVQEYASTSSMAVIRSVLADLGYNTYETIIGGNEFGCLEDRKRMAVVALSKGITEFDITTLKPSQVKEPNIKSILEPIPLDSSLYREVPYLEAKALRDAANSKGFKRQLLTGDEPKCGTIGRLYHKWRSTEPMLVNSLNNKLQRLFTPIEHCRLKKIPEKIIAGVSNTIAHEILGQSVTWPAFSDLACHLGTALKNWAYKQELPSAA